MTVPRRSNVLVLALCIVQASALLSTSTSAVTASVDTTTNDVETAAIIPSSLPIPKYPRYMQCDPRWGNTLMGISGQGERATICREGCAMTSLAMALSGLGVRLLEPINGSTVVTPGSLNAYLERARLYDCAVGDCNNLILQAPEALTGTLELEGELSPPPPAASMAASLSTGSVIYLAHVRNNSHFVLLTGTSTSTTSSTTTSEVVFTVHDPYYNTSTYTHSDIGDVIAYRRLAPSDVRARLVPHTFPLYKQCDPRWGKDLIVHETVCAVGCLMSSISMGLNGHGVLVAGKDSNPGTLNAWLRTHSGYTSGDDLEESALPRINTSAVAWPADGMHTSNDLDVGTLRGYLLRGRTVVANVLKGRHFVLAVGWEYNEPDKLLVHDSGFNTTAYSMSKDVVGWRVFDMGPGLP